MELQRIKDFVYTSKPEGLQYPPILDWDPIEAAESLTIRDSLDSLRITQGAFEGIRHNTNNFPILKANMLFSSKTFSWFAIFFTHLEQIIKGTNLYKIPYEKCPKNEDEPQFYLPFNIRPVSAVKFIPQVERIKIKNKDVVNLYRVKYIQNDFELDDFRDGFPNWMIFSKTTIFESYNAKSNVRIRVDYHNGEFLYFIAGASDNWQQVQEVPIEIDHVVLALLFKN